jgi:hypothetical protein
MAFSILANSNREVNESQEKKLTFGSLSFYIRPSGSTRLLDPKKSIPSVGKAERMTTSGSSVGSSSEVNSLVSLAATKNLLGKLEEPKEIGQEIIMEETVDKSRDTTNTSSSASRSVHRLCVIIIEAAEEENSHSRTKRSTCKLTK